MANLTESLRKVFYSDREGKLDPLKITNDDKFSTSSQIQQQEDPDIINIDNFNAFTQNVGISYVIKNIVIFVLVVLIILFLTKKFNNKNSETLEYLKEREKNRNSENSHHEIIEKLRNKKKLETRSEKILNKDK